MVTQHPSVADLHWVELWNLVFLVSQGEIDNEYSSEDIEVNSKTVSIGVVLLKKKAQLEANIGFTTSNKGSDALLLGFDVGSEIKTSRKIKLVSNIFICCRNSH